MLGDWHVQIDRSDYDRRWTLRAAQFQHDGSTAVLAGGGLFLFEPGKATTDADAPPLFKDASSVTVRAFLQAIVDAAWREGIRPSDLNDWRAKTAGVDAHLQDMRKLVAKLTETPL